MAIKNKKSTDEKLLNLKIDLFRSMHERKMDKPTMRALANFLKMYVYFSEPTSYRIFTKEIQLLTNDITTMGIEELILSHTKQEGIELGIKQGAERNSEKVVKNLITKMGLTDEKAADIAGVDVAFVARIRKELGQ